MGDGCFAAAGGGMQLVASNLDKAFLTNAFDEKGILSYNAVCSPTFCGQWKRAYPIKPQFFGAKFSQDF